MTPLLIKTHSYIVFSWAHELQVTHANKEAPVLRKKVMHYGHILSSAHAKNVKKKFA